jgi:acid phosphatase family membrane protein YuiD
MIEQDDFDEIFQNNFLTTSMSSHILADKLKVKLT